MMINKTESVINNKFILNYIDNQSIIDKFFSYKNDDSSYEKRIIDIKHRLLLKQNIIDRVKLAEILKLFNKKLAGINNENNIDISVENNIDAIANDALTIVTGQQAGIFTGPIYTINKIISLIKLSKDFTKKYNEPIVPVFWVAGEDHDIDEIDHIYLNSKDNIKKLALDWNKKPQTSVSNVILRKEQVKELIEQLKESLPDSTYKKSIIEKLYNIYLDNSLSVAFSAIIYNLFSCYGLVLIDSHDPILRQYEKEIFIEIINKTDDISMAINVGLNNFKKEGYNPLVSLEKDKLGIFINVCNKRSSIYKQSNDNFFIKNINKTVSKNEMIELIEEQPDIFSTNVLLRPIMQEYLLQPVIYIGGQAEVMYWGQLKPLFELFQYNMPAVKLRDSYTYVTNVIRSLLDKYEIDINMLFKNENDIKQDFLKKGQLNYNFDLEIEKLLEKLVNECNGFINKIPEDFVSKKTALNLGNQYLVMMNRQLNKLKQNLYNEHIKNYNKELLEINHVKNELLPFNKLQERVLNIFYFINSNGYDFLEKVINDDNADTCSGHYYINI